MGVKLVGVSRALRDIEQEIGRVAPLDAKVLITGESGVGKDVAARLIHERSHRKGPFVAINCAAVPDGLLESELFGHERGAFTGAYRDKRGWLERAQGGTMFLDEIGEMSPRMQALLLRFCENGELQRVGSDRVQTVDNVRVIAATNRNLIERIETGHFREDLYYRMNVIHLVMPPLRQRPEDVPPLIAHFLDTFSVVYQVPRPALAEQTLAQLTAYAWPGNVRELANVMERLVVRQNAGIIAPADLPIDASRGHGLVPASASQRAGRSTADTLYARMANGGESFWAVIYDPFTSHDLTRDDLRAVVARGLQETRGNYRQLVRLFNVPSPGYRRLLNFLQKHGCRLPFHEFRTMRRAPAQFGEVVDSAPPGVEGRS